MELLTALSIGLVGSIHCLGMCGPIALAIPLDRSSKFNTFAGSLSYNVGRVVTYSIIGFVFGFIGYGFSLIGFQQWVSILAGIFMIASVVWPRIIKGKGLNLPKFSLWIGSLKGGMSKRFGSKSLSNLFAIGLLNGLLPCGLVYMGLAGSVSMETALKGSLFMLFFGLGTLPMMFIVAFYGSHLKARLFKKGRKLIPIFIVLIGILFILRGLNLGIPYLSPKLVKDTEEIICH